MGSKAMAVVVAVALLHSGGIASAADAGTDAVRAEQARRNEALIQHGFSLTQGFNFRDAGEQVLRVELVVPPSASKHIVRIWAAARGGEVAVRFAAPDGKTLVEWSARSGERTLVRRLPAGRYVFEIDPRRAQGASALLGVKGPAISLCPTEAARLTEHLADPSRGFHWPYLLYLPKQVRARHLLIAPNNTGFATQDIAFLRASGSCQVARSLDMLDRLGVPLLVPLFPRPAVAGEEENLYLHALTRASLTTRIPAFRRVDLQLLAMIEDAREALAGAGAKVSAKVLLSGFSAAGSFVNRFALLHPENVLAVASGSPGGWPTVPVKVAEGWRLSWPVGIADVEALTGKTVDVPALAKVAWFFFLGDQDANDAVPSRDAYSKSQQALVFRLFGPTPVSRWKKAGRLYSEAGLEAGFRLYPGVGHSTTREIDGEVEAFFVEAMKKTE